MLNTTFEAEGINQQFDHRSYKRQGVDFIPQVHEGKTATALRRKRKPVDSDEYSEIAYKIKQNDLIKEYNNQLAEIIRERERTADERREPPDPTDKVIDLEHTKRTDTTLKRESNSSAIQEPVTDTKLKPIKKYKYSTNNRTENRAVFDPNNNLITERQALHNAKAVKAYERAGNKLHGETNIYRSKLADLTKSSNPSDIANNFKEQTLSALECERVI